MENPLQDIIQSMFKKLNDPKVTTAKLAQIIMIASESREGLLEEPENCPAENISWVNESIIEYTKIIVQANHKAQRMLNGDLVPESCDAELEEALTEISQQLISA